MRLQGVLCLMERSRYSLLCLGYPRKCRRWNLRKMVVANRRGFEAGACSLEAGYEPFEQPGPLDFGLAIDQSRRRPGERR